LIQIFLFQAVNRKIFDNARYLVIAVKSNFAFKPGKSMILTKTSVKRYSINSIREEATNLLEMGVIALNQPLRILFEYLPAKEWGTIECELERHDYLLRDRIIDLVGEVNWDCD